MSTTSDVITPITSPKTPLATVEEPMSTSIYKKKGSNVEIKIQCYSKFYFCLLSERVFVISQTLLKVNISAREGRKPLLPSTSDHEYSCNQLLFPINKVSFQRFGAQSMSPR